MERNSYSPCDPLDRVYLATKVCVRGEIKEETELRLKTIRNSVGRGHESVLEHSNLIMTFVFSKTEFMAYLNEILDVLECCHYLNYRIYTRTDSCRVIIIAGSLRGYKHIFRNIKSFDNDFLEAIKAELYTNSLSVFFEDFIKDGLMDANKFNTFIGPEREIFYDDEADFLNKNNVLKLRKVTVLGHDNLRKVIDFVYASTGILIPFTDALDFSTIQIKFNKISRTASHQLVRHRDAISQESQRYVNYRDAEFINPEIEDRIAAGKFKLNNDSDIATRLDRTAIKLAKEYDALIEAGMKKENARSILPSNIETTLIMTFTYRNLIKAIELRTDPAAQSEIRNLFKDVKYILENKILNWPEGDDRFNIYDYICTCKENHYFAQLDGDEDALDYIEEPASEDYQVYEEKLTDSETEDLVEKLNTELSTDLSKIYDPQNELPQQLPPNAVKRDGEQFNV